MIFETTPWQDRKIEEWRKKHKCKNKHANTAIGGKIQYVFIPTGLGTLCIVRCVCGSEFVVNELDTPEEETNADN